MRLWRINRLFEENEFWGENNIYAPKPLSTIKTSTISSFLQAEYERVAPD
jgi:hypothetical protein